MISTVETVIRESPAWGLCVVFSVGALASLGSCLLVRLPVVIGCVAGSGVSKGRGLLLTGLFALGLVLSYVLLGFAMAFMGVGATKVLVFNKYIFWLLGVVLFVAGIWISGLLSLRSLPDQCQRIGTCLRCGGLVGTFFMGILFGFLVMPACPSCGTGLLVLVRVVVSQNLSAYGLLVFAAFGLGQSLPVLAVGTLTGLIKPDLVKWLRTRMCSIEQRMQLIAGNVLMVFGVYFVVVG